MQFRLSLPYSHLAAWWTHLPPSGRTYQLVAFVLQRQQRLLQAAPDVRMCRVALEIRGRELLELVLTDVFVIVNRRNVAFDHLTFLHFQILQ